MYFRKNIKNHIGASANTLCLLANNFIVIIRHMPKAAEKIRFAAATTLAFAPIRALDMRASAF